MPDKNRLFYGYIIVVLCFLAMMVVLGLHSSFGIFIKPVLIDFQWTRAVISGAFSLSQIAHGLFGIAMGGLSDKYGPRVAMTICGLLSGIGYLLMSQVESIWQLYLFYGVIIGAGSSVFVPLLSTVARWFVKRRSMMTGIVFAGIGVGMLVLPVIIDRLISTYDWRITFAILGITIMVVVIITAQFLKRDPGQAGYTAYSEDNTVQRNMKLETKSFSLRDAVHTRQFWMLFTILVCYGYCFFSIQVHIVPYVTDLGISTSSAAAILATVGGATIIGQTVLGSTGDKIGNRQAFLIGIVLIVLTGLGLMVTGELWAFFCIAAILGIAFGDCGTQESPLVAWLFGLASHGVIFGFMGFGFTVGAAIGPLLTAHIFDVTGSYWLAFLICTALALIATILTIFLSSPISESAQNFTD
ncbi:MFS transporter [Chloroflexota bacterium]